MSAHNDSINLSEGQCYASLRRNKENAIESHKMKYSRCHARYITSMRAFVGFAGVVMCAQSALAIYSKSVLTSIEKRFRISSSLAGFIVGSFNIGNLLFVVAVSKLSSTGHRPRIMAIGSLLIALGGFVNFLPHLINDPYQPYMPNSTDSATGHQTSPTTTTSSTNHDEYSYLFLVLIFGEILQGIGATVHIPLSSSYIDDFASKDNSPVYLGISFVLQNIGPGFGYLIGSWTSTLYVDFDRIPAGNISISSDDKESWVGAWWLGYLIISCWVVFAAAPLFFFPKSMKKESSSDDSSSSNEEREVDRLMTSKSEYILQSADGVEEEGANPDAINNQSPYRDVNSTEQLCFCKDFMLTVKRLVTNSIYMSIVFGYSGLMFVVGSLTAFMPKFLEIVFQKSPGAANLTFGLAVPPTMCLGLLSGGLIVKKFKWQRKNILKFVVSAGTVALIPISTTFLISCSNSNSNCLNSTETIHSNSTFERICDKPDCDVSSVLFVVITSLGAMLAANMVTPIYTVVLRSVDPVDKCTAIGVMFLIIRILGLVPAPVISGAVIDQTCVKWNEDRGTRKNCIEYNLDQFRFRFLSLITFGILACVVFNMVAYLLVRRENNEPGPLSMAKSFCLRRFKHKSRDEVTEVTSV